MILDHTLIFGRAMFLWALVGLIPLAFLFWSAHRRRERLLSKIVALRLRAALLSSASSWKGVVRSILLLLAWVCLVLALAEPRCGYEEKKIVSHGRDVMIAIDTSRSMLATDVTPTRLARAGLLGQDVLDLLPGDRIGLIAFAGSAFLQAPMTLDHSAVRTSLAELDTALIPKGGTNISEAIQTAEVAFGKGEGTSRALVIITDGEDLEEDAVATAKQAAEQGIKIFTIGIGSAAGSLIPIKNENGESDFVRDEHGKPVLSKLDEARLKEIAQVTGGFYEPFSSQAARTIVEKGIIPLEAGMTGEMSARRPIERYEIPASVALLLLVLSILLRACSRKSGKPDSRSYFFAFLRRRKIGCWIAIGLIAASNAQATSGIQEYQEGNYEAALQNFEQRLKKIPSSPEVRFDAGTAAYKKGDYQKAAGYFTSAMTASDKALQEAATYNLANTLVRSGEQQQGRDIKLSDWKNALQHYDTVLKQDPNNKNAKENRELVKKLIDDLQKKQEEKNPPQNKNQQDEQNKNQQQQKQDQQQSQNNQQKENNQQQQGSGNDAPSPTPTPSPNDLKNQQGSSGQGQQQGGATPTPTPSSLDNKGSSAAPSPSPAPTPSSSEQQQGGGEKSSQQQQPSGSSQSSPRPTPGEKKSGALQPASEGGEQPVPSAEEEKEGKEMSRHQAEALLRSVQEEEQQVKFQQRRNSEEVTKDW